jgi:hypothetical protein
LALSGSWPAATLPATAPPCSSLYFGACIVAGGFTLLPGRYLGDLVLGQWLGLV